MAEKLLENLMKQYLIQIEIPNKNSLLADILEIQNNMTGRIGVEIANSFILEASQLLINSIFLFEKGFFDCAYYSLRQSIELSTTMVYLSDMPVETRKQKLTDWNNNKNFPMQSQMLNELKEKGDIFSNMKQKMPTFFEKLHNIYRKLNKIIHKQGSYRFYTYRLFRDLDKYKEINDFVFYLKKTIGIVAVMRLSIDPFPILLLDDEIYHRVFESISDAYSKEFVSKYIEENTVEEYKQTLLFYDTYHAIMKLEKREGCVSDIVWNHFINLQQEDKIIKQFHLIPRIGQMAVLISFLCKTPIMVYAVCGLCSYFTSLSQKENPIINSSDTFKKYIYSKIKYNQKFHNNYLSVFKCQNEDLLLQHLTPLTNEEFDSINQGLKVLE